MLRSPGEPNHPACIPGQSGQDNDHAPFPWPGRTAAWCVGRSLFTTPLTETGDPRPDPAPRMWFLAPDERANPDSDLDQRHATGLAWTGGNAVEALVHGAPYFARLASELAKLGRGDRVLFTDWRGDADERLDDAGPDIGDALASAARRGVDVRGLVWRSHSDKLQLSASENRGLAREINEAGGEALLDERVRTLGSHHQKMLIIRHGDDESNDVAYAGGIDLCHGRRDTADHGGDPQGIPLDLRYGPTPPWHDLQLEIRGPAVDDLVHTFRERWDDPTPLDHSNVAKVWRSRLTSRQRRTKPIPDLFRPPPPKGPCAVQILRTYPVRRIPYPFARHGERSVARAYAKAVARARSFIYVEDQYLWSAEVAKVFADALSIRPDLHLIAVVPRFPDRSGRTSGPPSFLGRQHALDVVRSAGGSRVTIYDLENLAGTPVYVHAKVCIIDDVWVSVGSDNLNLRSWTHDSELSCAVIDSERDLRSPRDPGGLGDGARRFARSLRLQLWAEHLGLDVDDDRLVDPTAGLKLWRRKAAELEAWHAGGRRGAHPPQRARRHRSPRVGYLNSAWAMPMYRLMYDPDGRPRALKQRDQY